MHVTPEDWDVDFAFPNFNLTLCVAIWPVTGQGFQNTKWPAVLYYQ